MQYTKLFKTSRHPCIMSLLPLALYVEVRIYFKQLSHTQYLLLVTYDYSRYPVVKSVISTSSHHGIHVLDQILSMFGVSEMVKSDNGPPFQCANYNKYAQYLGS